MGICMIGNFTKLQAIMNQLVDVGNFIACVVASEDGLVVASAVRENVNQDIAAALTSLVQQTVERVKKELEIGDIRYVIIDGKKGKVIFKSINGKSEDLILAVIVPPGVKTFKRVISKATKEIGSIFSA